MTDLDKLAKQRTKEFAEANADAKERVIDVRGNLPMKTLFILCSRLSTRSRQLDSLSNILDDVFKYMYFREVTEREKERSQIWLRSWEDRQSDFISKVGLRTTDASEYLEIKVRVSDKVWDKVMSNCEYLFGDNQDTYTLIRNCLAFLSMTSLSYMGMAERYELFGMETIHHSEMCVRQELGVPKSSSEDVIIDLDIFKSLTSDAKIDAFYALALKIYERLPEQSK